MRTKGYSVSYREYDGDHDPDCWREDLSLALPWAWRRR
jgi:enterochelin esterase-like enzyme